ncbi:hypothetical protein FF1_037899 [Malus domestica]
MPSGLVFFLGCFVLLESVATAYVCFDPRLFLRIDDLENDANSTPLEAAARRQRIVREESPDPNPFWTRILPLTQINQRSDEYQPLHNHHYKPSCSSSAQVTNACLSLSHKQQQTVFFLNSPSMPRSHGKATTPRFPRRLSRTHGLRWTGKVMPLSLAPTRW